MSRWVRRALVLVPLCLIFCGLPVPPAAAQRTPPQQARCPCSIWRPSEVPTTPAASDGQPIEVGVKFRSDVDGAITALRFYKAPTNTGLHVGHLWSRGGTLLATASFTNESPSGWQEAALNPPVAIKAEVTYVASYHSSSGFFAFGKDAFAARGVDAPPLHALRSGVDGGNGVFRYGASGFPNSSAANNYWVDVVLQADIGPDTVPPVVVTRTPDRAATNVPLMSAVLATFSEPLDPASVTSSGFELRDPSGAALPVTVRYDPATRTARVMVTAGFLAQTMYTARLIAGPAGVRDRAGNALADEVAWSFTTAPATAPPPDYGPGGPILVIASASNPFGRYYAEILSAEGLNEFRVTDISRVTPEILAGYDVAILGEMPVTAATSAMLSQWVTEGGNLIAMRPARPLAGLLGLGDPSSTLANAYLRVDTTAEPGAGIVAETMQFHGSADRYGFTSATVIASLFTDAATATTNPAVTLASVGTRGGQAAAFTFDLARSIVYTRQGNPAWAGQERDGVPPIRSNDLFFGAAVSEVKPDWIDLTKVEIPQADEQQRLLANLILHMNRTRKPLPRFWYLPRAAKAALVMTGDDHGGGGTAGRFTQFKTLSAPGCRPGNWECIRGTSYIALGTRGLDDAAARDFVREGFEVAIHITTNCEDWTPATLADSYTQQLARFRTERPALPVPRTNRTHCIAWSDYVTQAKVARAHGIRFDTNYYFYPADWVRNRPGLFTGSAMPMRFADVDGTTIDVYQAVTQMNDEAGQVYPFTADTLFDRALGPAGYFGVFTANMHTDLPTTQPSDATVSSAISRGIPVVSAKQMLDWLDGRNRSSFGSVAFDRNVLTFTIAAAPGSNGLTAMVPAQARGAALTGITRGGSAVAFTIQVVKGVSYAFFEGAAGTYAVTYAFEPK